MLMIWSRNLAKSAAAGRTIRTSTASMALKLAISLATSGPVMPSQKLHLHMLRQPQPVPVLVTIFLLRSRSHSRYRMPRRMRPRKPLHNTIIIALWSFWSVSALSIMKIIIFTFHVDGDRVVVDDIDDDDVIVVVADIAVNVVCERC